MKLTTRTSLILTVTNYSKDTVEPCYNGIIISDMQCDHNCVVLMDGGLPKGC